MLGSKMVILGSNMVKLGSLMVKLGTKMIEFCVENGHVLIKMVYFGCNIVELVLQIHSVMG